jgi:hypothetical protein
MSDSNTDSEALTYSWDFAVVEPDPEAETAEPIPTSVGSVAEVAAVAQLLSAVSLSRVASVDNPADYPSKLASTLTTATTLSGTRPGPRLPVSTGEAALGSGARGTRLGPSWSASFPETATPGRALG